MEGRRGNVAGSRRGDDGRPRRNFEKRNGGGREKKQEEGDTQLAPGRVVALSSNRPCSRGPTRALCAYELRAEKFNSALACVATSSDISLVVGTQERAGFPEAKRNAPREPAGQQKERSEIPRAWN